VADLVGVCVARDQNRAGCLRERALRVGRHDDVDGAKHLSRACGTRVHIAHDVTCLSAPVRNLAHRLAQGSLHRTVHDDASALRGERKRDRTSDLVTTVVDDRDFAVESLFHDQYPFNSRAWYTVRVTRKQVVSRIVYGVFVVGVGAFIISNVTQVARVTFGDPSINDFPKVEAACGAAIEAEIAAIDRARIAASGEKSAESARSAYAAARKASSSELQTACAGAVDALAAVGRLDRSAESHSIRDASEIGPMRQSARSFIKVPQ